MRKNNTLSKKQKIIHALSETTVKSIELSRNSLEKYLTLFLYYSGLRISEALSLNVSNVANQDYVVILGKGNKERTIYLSQKAKVIIEKLILLGDKIKTYSQNRPLFLSQKGTRLSRTQAWRLVKKYEINKTLRVSPHTMRHTFATISLRKGVNVKYVSTQLGHSSTAMTHDIYQHATLEDLKFTEML